MINPLLEKAVKKPSERKILRYFLEDSSLSGVSRLQELEAESERIAQETIVDKIPNNYRQGVIDLYLGRLKTDRVTDGTSLYLDLIYRLILNQNPKLARDIRKLRSGVIAPTDMPRSFPKQFKKAEALLIGKLRSELGSEQFRRFLAYQGLAQRIRSIAKNVRFAINNGLNERQTARFLGLVYELEKNQAAQPTNARGFKDTIVRAIFSGETLDLIHIKCLRFTYPYGNRMCLIPHIADTQVPTKDGGLHRPLSEVKLFSRLTAIVNIFSYFGVRVRQLILLSDQDLDDYFPNGGEGVVPNEDILAARQDLACYQKAVETATEAEVYYLRDYLFQTGRLSAFDQKRQSVIAVLKLGKSHLPEGFIEERINYRHASNLRIFANPPSRQFARDRIYAQLASMQALAVLGSKSPDACGVILIEESKGDENQFIGGVKKSALPVYFVNLRDNLED